MHLIKTKKTLVRWLVIFQIFALIIPQFFPVANADVVNIGNPGDFANPVKKGVEDSIERVSELLENKYHMGQGAIQEIGEYLNVSKNKGQAPEVKMLFNPISPKLGQKLTATALPSFFNSTKDSMYFTWYIKHNNGDESGTDAKGRKTKDGNTDWNEDGDIDIEDYKIEAMKLIVKNGYRADLKAEYDGDADSDDDGFGTLDSFVQNGIVTDDICDDLGLGEDLCKQGIEVREKVKDLCPSSDFIPNPACTKAPFGGFNIKKPTGGFRCYVQDFESGKFYEIVEDSGADSGDLSGCTVSVDSEDGTETGKTDDGRYAFRFTKSGDQYCLGGQCSVNVSCPSGEAKTYTFPNPTTGDCPSSPDGSNGGRYADSDGFLWKAKADESSSSPCKLVVLIPESFGEEDDEDESGYSTRFHHLNPYSYKDQDWMPHGTAFFPCDDSPSFDTCTLKAGGLSFPMNKVSDILGLDECRERFDLATPGSSLPPGGVIIDCVTAEGETYSYDISAKGNVYGDDIIFDDPTCKCTEEESVNENLPSTCTHLFPDTSNLGFVVGDGEFTDEEEEFWGTDPRDPDTAGGGVSDEAALAGVGRDVFSWTYNKGDELGVVTEGLSTNSTKHEDSSDMVMWALPKNIFHKKGGNEESKSECKLKNKGSYTKKINGFNVEIDSAEIDINACLEENLVNPMEGGQAENIKIELTASPSDPINDSSGSGKGDLVSVQSMITNASSNNTKNIYYKWEIKGNDTIVINDEQNSNPEWQDVTDDILIGMREGINKDAISFKLDAERGSATFNKIFGNSNSNYGYLKVRLDAEEYFERGEKTRSGSGEIILRVSNNNDNGLEITGVEYIDGKLVKQSGQDSEFCDEGVVGNDSVCYVPDSKIVRVSVDNQNLRNFSWTLNGKSLECDNSISNECSDSQQGRTVYFPISGNPGDRYVINVMANDTQSEGNVNATGGSGAKASITQIFQIADPIVKLGPSGGIGEDCKNLTGAGFESKELGIYTDVMDSENPISDCSARVFEGNPGVLKVQANFNPPFIGAYVDEIKWLVNGQEQVGVNDTELIFNTTEGVSSYNVSFSAIYRQDRSIRKALIDKFGMNQFDSADVKLGDSIKINMTQGNPTEGMKKTTRIMASLATNLSGQMLFLFRISMTVAAVIFISGTVLSLGKQED